MTTVVVPSILTVAAICGALLVFRPAEIKSAINLPSSASKYEVGPPTREELLELVNAERAKVGAKPLVERAELDQSAQRKADDMVKYNYFEHVSPHDNKVGAYYVFDTMKSCQYASENLNYITGEDATTYKVIVEGWDKSKPHYEAMVDKDYEYIGFGYNKGKTVAHFCDLQAR